MQDCIFKMKGQNLSRNQLLDWINSVVASELGTLRKVEELGNGAAYLLLLAALRPGSIRMQKVHRQPVGYHQVAHNLRLLASTFEKLGLEFKVEVDKLAQMKYQDNFYLAAYLHKLAHQPKTTTLSPPPTQEEKPKKFKVRAPEKPVQIPLQKEEPAAISTQQLNALQASNHRNLQQAIHSAIDSTQNLQKLRKIAQILQIEHKHSPPKPTIQVRVVKEPLTMEQSIKQLVRPSICNRSRYLGMFEEGKFEQSVAEERRRKAMMQAEAMVLVEDFSMEGEMLLSARKEDEPKQPERQRDEKEKELGKQAAQETLVEAMEPALP